MCLNPVHVRNPTQLYTHSSYDRLTAPCGHCIECQQQKKSEWQARISYEIHSLYKRGGCAIFLTFTYDNVHLPYYYDKKNNFGFVCFNHKHVLSFLNQLKVTIHRKYGKGMYKYFFVSEYGKTTRRPHYHSIFFIEKGVDIVYFIETCRNIWKHGFMFPRRYQGQYVDNKMNTVTPEIRSLAGGAKYVSKYCTKDITYYNIPEIAHYLSITDNKERMKKYLPKHWQSNKLGYTILDFIDLYNFDWHLKNGVYNPLSGKTIPLPSYFINKMCFKNVNSSETCIPKLAKGSSSDKQKYLYYRDLTDFGKQFIEHSFTVKIHKTANRLRERLAQLRNDESYIYKFTDPSEAPYLASAFSFNDTDFIRLSLYHHVYRTFCADKKDRYFTAFKNADVQFFAVQYMNNHLLASRIKDTLEYNHAINYYERYSAFDKVFCDKYDIIDNIISSYCEYNQKIKLEEHEKQNEERRMLRERYMHRYNLKLC